ncbi:MAG: NUDIX hydrolase [Anaerolineae bacterium]
MSDTQKVNHRVRAILLTEEGNLLLIKRLRDGFAPYWVLPGGGVEITDESFEAALHRELAEELGGTAEVLHEVFTSEYPGWGDLQGWIVRHHYYVCRLVGYDISQRHGPEFSDPTRGQYIPENFPLESAVLSELNIYAEPIKAYLVAHAAGLRSWL